MITILKTGYYNILKLFYKNKKIRLHFREIARQTSLHEPSAARILKQLEKENLLQSEKQGNLKIFSLKDIKPAYTVLTLFDIEKYERLPHIRKTAIKHYLNALPQQPVFALLFGSTAKENFREDSDIDILLVTNTPIDTKKAEYEADAQSAMKISTFQMTYKSFIQELKLKNDPVIQSAMHTGYPLINHIKYYEAIRDETA